MLTIQVINNIFHPFTVMLFTLLIKMTQRVLVMHNKHTVIVPPGKTVTAMLTADEVGEWAIHCHLLYHMSAGMMSKLIVANVDDTKTPMQTPVQSSQGESHVHH